MFQKEVDLSKSLPFAKIFYKILPAQGIDLSQQYGSGQNKIQSGRLILLSEDVSILLVSIFALEQTILRFVSSSDRP